MRDSFWYRTITVWRNFQVSDSTKVVRNHIRCCCGPDKCWAGMSISEFRHANVPRECRLRQLSMELQFMRRVFETSKSIPLKYRMFGCCRCRTLHCYSLVHCVVTTCATVNIAMRRKANKQANKHSHIDPKFADSCDCRRCWQSASLRWSNAVLWLGADWLNR